MTRYFAEINGIDRTVQRVLVCNDPDWLATRLGGEWVETADPYSTAPQTVVYCGPGHGYDPEFPEQFAPQWVQPVAIADPEPGEDPWTWYPFGARVFHNGRIWRSRVAENVWEPGVAAWHDAPPGEIPTWFQPTGSADAYAAVDDETGEPMVVIHNGKTWVNTHGDGNVWVPGEFGWTEVGAEPDTAWVQPAGGHDAYNTGDVVTHNGQTWTSTVDGNVWEPGVYGWVAA